MSDGTAIARFCVAAANRAGAMGDFSRHPYRLAQRGMWMDRLANVDGVAPISIASATSLIRSRACVPTMPPPMMRCVESSKISLVNPSSRPFAIARPLACHGNFPTLTLIPCAFLPLQWFRPMQFQDR